MIDKCQNTHTQLSEHCMMTPDGQPTADHLTQRTQRASMSVYVSTKDCWKTFVLPWWNVLKPEFEHTAIIVVTGPCINPNLVKREKGLTGNKAQIASCNQHGAVKPQTSQNAHADPRPWILPLSVSCFKLDQNYHNNWSFYILYNSDEQWDCENNAEDEWGDDLAHSHLHKAPLSQRDLQVAPTQLQHRQTHLRPVPHSAGGWSGKIFPMHAFDTLHTLCFPFVIFVKV